MINGETITPSKIESLFHNILGIIKNFGNIKVKKIVIIDKIKNIKKITLLFHQKKIPKIEKKTVNTIPKSLSELILNFECDFISSIN